MNDHSNWIELHHIEWLELRREAENLYGSCFLGCECVPWRWKVRLTKYIEIQFLEGYLHDIFMPRSVLGICWILVRRHSKDKDQQTIGSRIDSRYQADVDPSMLFISFSSCLDKAVDPRGLLFSGSRRSHKTHTSHGLDVHEGLNCHRSPWVYFWSSLCQNMSKPSTDPRADRHADHAEDVQKMCILLQPPFPLKAPFGGSSTAHFAALDAAPAERCRAEGEDLVATQTIAKNHG